MRTLMRDGKTIPLSERATRRRLYIGENIEIGDIVGVHAYLGNFRGEVVGITKPVPTCGYTDEDRNVCAPWIIVKEYGRIPVSVLATQIEG